MSHARSAASPSATRWRWTAGWAALILVATSLPSSAIPKVEFDLADKAVHFVMYGVLGALVARALGGRLSARTVLAALVVLMVFAGLDEWHQSFIPGRYTDVLDWCADAIGACAGLLAGQFLLPLARTRQDLLT